MECRRSNCLKNNKWIVAALALLVGGLVGAAAWAYISDSGEPATAQPGVPPTAKTDEEWIALIKTAEKIRSGEIPAALPSPSIPNGVTLLTSCETLPPVLHFSAVANEPGPLPNTGRTVFRFTDVSESGDGPQYALVVDWRDNVSMCDSRVKVTVTNAVAEEAAIDAHICDQMRVAADGNKMTDQTLRQPSAVVAKEYLAAFCP